MPQAAVDPVVLAASIVVRLQTIVAREIAPGDPAVLTVGSIQELNSALADLIRRGALVASVVPEHSVLERQFREAVGDPQ